MPEASTKSPPIPLDAAVIVRRARRLRFLVRPEAVSRLAGAYHGARPGIGLIFAELRPYEPGDDVRHMDWNVTARQGKPYVRRYVEERALVLWIMVDVSASMRFGPEGKTKADRAAQAAALLATAAVQNGDRVGLLLVSDRLEAEIAPGIGVRHLSQLIRGLVATPTCSTRTDLDVALTRIRRSGRRSLLVAISDFEGEQAVGAWRQAARRNEVVAVRFVDPCEEALPDAGLIRLESAEQGRRRTVDSHSRRVRARYAEVAEARRAAFTRWCAATGVDGFTISTEHDPISPLIELFSNRAKRRGGP
jgi:uncharacterized protein (DUF58 family)